LHHRVLKKFLEDHAQTRSWIVKQFSKRVRLAQRAIRGFLVVTRARYEVLDRLWLKHEHPTREACVRQFAQDVDAADRREKEKLAEERKKKSVVFQLHRMQDKARGALERLEDVQAISKYGVETRGQVAAIKNRLEIDKEDALWHQIWRDPIPHGVRVRRHRQLLIAQRRWFIAHVDQEKEATAKNRMQREDARRLIVGSHRVTLQISEKQLGWHVDKHYPSMTMYVFLSHHEAPFHTQWFESMKSLVHSDVEKVLDQALEFEHSRALKVLRRAL